MPHFYIDVAVIDSTMHKAKNDVIWWHHKCLKKRKKHEFDRIKIKVIIFRESSTEMVTDIEVDFFGKQCDKSRSVTDYRWKIICICLR